MDESHLRGADVCRVLRGKRIDALHHANTVQTSCVFLQEGGLASRGYVAASGLPQTEQYSDPVDRRFGVWDDVFMDTVDIHERARKRNLYGPVSFVMPVGLLEGLPPEAHVLVTKKNPVKWRDVDHLSDRFFTSPAELESGLVKGTFDQIVVIRTPTGIVPFPSGPFAITLDDPRRTLSSGEDAFRWAARRLTEASEAAKRRLGLTKNDCRDGCRCVAEYAAHRDLDSLFL